MARAGYHPDNSFAMHHLLRINSPERSRVGTFFFSDHPRWETRDQRTERAYTEALAEYNRLWTNPETSPGGAPPAVAFLGDTRGIENKEGGTGDLTLTLSCRNVGTPVGLIIHLTNGRGSPVRTIVSDYQDSSGNVVIHEHAACSDADSTKPTIIHIPTAVISSQDRKLRAQVEVIGPSDEILERSRVFDVHFPKTAGEASAMIAKVRVEPELGERPVVKQADHDTVANAVLPAPIHIEKSSIVPPLAATSVNRSNAEAAATPVPIHSEHSDPGFVVAAITTRVEVANRDHPSDAPSQGLLGVLPFSLDNSGVSSHWNNSLAPTSAATWWQASPSVKPTLTTRLSRSAISFAVQSVDTESGPATVVVTNDTPAVITISAIKIEGSDATDFTETTDCGHTIQARSMCTLTVMFRPAASGTRTGILTIDGTGQKISLAGVGK